jgi:transcriptional regulator with XRE-family HTH domain
MTITELCKRLDVSRQTLSNWRLGKSHPTPHNAAKIAAITGGDPLDYVREPTPDQRLRHTLEYVLHVLRTRRGALAAESPQAAAEVDKAITLLESIYASRVRPRKRVGLVCDADTPEQVVAAFITYNLFGEFNDR